MRFSPRLAPWARQVADSGVPRFSEEKGLDADGTQAPASSRGSRSLIKRQVLSLQ